MKQITLAIAIVLPVFSYAYRAVPLCKKVLKVENARSESIQDLSKNYCSFIIPAGTQRLIFHIGLNEKKEAAPVQLLSQLQDKLENGAPLYVVGGMIDSKPAEGRISINTYDHAMCAAMYTRNDPDQCRPLIWQRDSKGGTYDIQIVPVPYDQAYYICFKNETGSPECYATVEAVAIVK